MHVIESNMWRWNAWPALQEHIELRVQSPFSQRHRDKKRFAILFFFFFFRERYTSSSGRGLVRFVMYFVSIPVDFLPSFLSPPTRITLAWRIKRKTQSKSTSIHRLAGLRWYLIPVEVWPSWLGSIFPKWIRLSDWTFLRPRAVLLTNVRHYVVGISSNGLQKT